MRDRYNPDGLTAMARQHPLLHREEHDIKALTAAEEKRRRRAARLFKDAASWPKHGPTESPGKEFGGADERRLRKRARK